MDIVCQMSYKTNMTCYCCELQAVMQLSTTGSECPFPGRGCSLLLCRCILLLNELTFIISMPSSDETCQKHQQIRLMF